MLSCVKSVIRPFFARLTEHKTSTEFTNHLIPSSNLPQVVYKCILYGFNYFKFCFSYIFYYLSNCVPKLVCEFPRLCGYILFLSSLSSYLVHRVPLSSAQVVILTGGGKEEFDRSLFVEKLLAIYDIPLAALVWI